MIAARSHVAARGRIEPAGGLVEQHQARRSDQGLRDAQALPHALRIGRHAPVRRVRDAHALEQRAVVATRFALEPGVERHQFAAGHRAVEADALRQKADRAPRLGAAAACGVDARDADAARGGPDQPEQQLDQRGLARAVVPDQRGHLPGLQAERDAVDCGHAAIALGDRAPLRDQRHGDGGGGTATGRISGALSTTPPG